MKKTWVYALLSAIAITGMGFSSCSDNDAVAEPNPSYNSETGMLNVDFVFNVSTDNSASTRMTGEDTQASAGADFRGITNAYLATFKLPSDGKNVPYASTETNFSKINSFGTILTTNQLPLGQENKDNASQRIIELSIETGTNALAFWGKAIKTLSDMEQGKIEMNIDNTDMANTSFSLCKIVPDQPYTDNPHIYKDALLQHEKVMAAALTRIIRSGITNQTLSFTDETGTSTKKIEKLNWSDYVDIGSDANGFTLSASTTDPLKDAQGNDQEMCALGDKLSEAFATMNTIRENELRAGSGKAIANLMADLMSIINSVINAQPVSLREVVAQEVAKSVKTNVELFFDDQNEYKWRDATTIKGNVTTLNTDLILESCDFNVFPSTFNLPLGSVILEFKTELVSSNTDAVANQNYQFTYNYKGAVETYAMGGSSDSNDSFNPLNYVYPAELCYFGNSPIRVTNETLAASNYPNGATNWETDANWATNDWTKNGHVLSSTRSVALQHNINYGTALLETHVRYGAAVLEDNNSALHNGEQDNKIDVTGSDNHFVLTGVLIGGQEAEVGWNYLAKSSSPGFGHMVYDKTNKDIPHADAGNSSGAYSTANYTLVWDNWEQKQYDEGHDQRTVYVALEFKNNSRDFYGENNLIRSGGTFYIVGKLDPDVMSAEQLSDLGVTAEQFKEDKSKGIAWPANYALPPYDTNGNTIKQRRVFMQDFKTVANFVIGKESLKHALVAVPDLRTGQISLGLSVDLQWQKGLEFNDIILGK